MPRKNVDYNNFHPTKSATVSSEANMNQFGFFGTSEAKKTFNGSPTDFLSSIFLRFSPNSSNFLSKLLKLLKSLF